MYPEYCWWGTVWVFPLVMPVVVLLALILCFYFMFRRGRGGTSWQQPGAPPSAGREEESPLDILKRRYAKGEISKDEYEQIKRDLLS